MKLSALRPLIGLALIIALLAGCTPTTPPAPTATTPNTPTAPQVKTIKVGTMGTYSPFTFLDEAGKLTGYDIEVLRLLDERIPEIEFEFITASWEALFAGLDSDKFDLVANQIAKNPEREAKYLFPDQGYIFVQTQLVVHADDNERTSLADFAGAELGGVTGDYFSEMLEEYNDAHGNPFTMRYYGEEYVDIFMDIDNGRVAATVNDNAVVASYAQTLGLKIKCVGEVLEASASFFVVRQDAGGQELKALIDKAMDEVIADGSLAALCIEWFGEDYTIE
ncbi:MAG: transporter substrate-binding domain-containing protein [Symbiobacteriaceae bacterium]|nr:transporter substrate-binding domain-containing protein [Symbiobacteriaceae bacterium]